jgi:hypothetical protein
MDTRILDDATLNKYSYTLNNSNTALEIMKYATLADAGYGQGLTPIGWEIVKTSSVSSTGFASTSKTLNFYYVILQQLVFLGIIRHF